MVEQETLDDHINELPDDLLIQILSLLPTKDAVKSCVLSKRWSYLWNSLHNFHFVAATFKNEQNFISFVDHVLTHSTRSKINKFQVDFHCNAWDVDSKISEWLNFTVEKEAEDVGLHSYPFDVDLFYELPLSMYTCSSLITLCLSYWVIDKGMVIAWNSLKNLTLHSVELDNDDFVKLLSSCPSLETMELSYCEGFRRLEITSSNLKRLTLTEPLQLLDEGHDTFLEIFAPHLQHLDISGNLGFIVCRLENVSSLVTSSLTFFISCISLVWEEDEIEEESCGDYHQVFRNLVWDYLEKLSTVTELIIGTWFAEVVFMMKLEGVILPELRCKCLTLKLYVWKYNLYGIASLLQASPLLESLNINVTAEFRDFRCEIEQSYLAEVDKINLPSWIPNTVFPNLKCVKIVSCVTQCLKKWSKGGSCKLFELSKFLLKNAVALQKLVIVAKRTKCCTCSESCVSHHLSRLAENLLDSPRSSTNVVMIYQEIA